MAASSSFRLNRAGGAQLLKQVAAGSINAIAQKVAAGAGPDAVVAEYTTDRAAAAVSVPADQQARDGVLTKAVAAVGLEIRPK